MQNNRLKKLSLISAGALSAAALPVFILAPGQASQRQKAPFLRRSFAHRGLHSEDKSVPENSLEAFRLAAEARYGIELDVHLTRDGHVVVFHDDTLDRMCGVPGRIEDMSFDQLRLLRLCGTEQRIPLLTECLDVIHGRGPLIVEIKNGRENRLLCRKTYDILSRYEGDVCIESFNPMIVRWFRIHAADIVRGQLATHYSDYDGSVSRPTAFLLSRCLLNFLSRPQFIAYHTGKRPLSVRFSEALGAMKFSWVVRSERAERGSDSVIFEFYRPQRRL